MFSSDLDFLDWYVNKHYIFSGDLIYIKFNTYEAPITAHQFIIDITSIFGCDILDNGLSINEYVRSIIKSNSDNLKKDILDYLKFKFKVSLGPRSWLITDFSGKEFTIEDVCKSYKGCLNHKFLGIIVNNWFEETMITKSEAIILKF